jgi:hypothetical protein
MGQRLTRRANQRHAFIIAQSIKRPWAYNGALLKLQWLAAASDCLHVAEPPHFRRVCRGTRLDQRRSPSRAMRNSPSPGGADPGWRDRCRLAVPLRPAGAARTVAAMMMSPSPFQTNSSNRSPNQASKTSISVSVTGTSFGQSSDTANVTEARFARRAPGRAGARA